MSLCCALWTVLILVVQCRLSFQEARITPQGSRLIITRYTDNQGLHKNISALDSLVQSLSTQVQNLKSQMTVLNRNQDTVVLFKAHLSNHRAFGLWSTIVFDTVETNVGGGYNPHSGVFHVPITGIYTFTVMIDTWTDGFSYYQLYHQGFAECEMAVLSVYDSKTMTVTIRANKGSDIHVRKFYDSGNAQLRGGVWTQFSGHLLRAD